MPNEMMRPCTLWGQTFDACDVTAINDYLTFEEESAIPSMGYRCGVLIRDPFKGDIASPSYVNKRESYKAIIEAITTIAEALNAPVLATEEVLAGLPKDAKIYTLVTHDSNGIKTQMKCFLYWGLKDKKEGWMYREHDLDSLDGESYDYLVSKSDKLYADDPKTAEYLLQFTLDGKRKEME